VVEPHSSIPPILHLRPWCDHGFDFQRARAQGKRRSPKDGVNVTGERDVLGERRGGSGRVNTPKRTSGYLVKI
jgi:hypothetical protein